jgi:GntR family transcriptional regulator
MIISVDLYNPKSAYQQIADSVRKAIATGLLKAGDRLPPIRETAVQTRVNRNTVSRAYLELEHQGLVQARQGSGYYVTEAGPSRQREERLVQVKAVIDELAMQASLAQVAEDDLLDLVRAGIASLETDTGDQS